MRSLIKNNRTISVITTKQRPLMNGEVRLKVALAGICRTDVLVANDLIPTPKNITLGHEVCGLVVDTYSGCSIPINSHATIVPFYGCNHCVNCHNERYDLCDKSKMMGMHVEGLFADDVVVHESNVKLLPKGIDMRLAAMTEPIAAVLAVKKAIDKNQAGLILGNNRIAKLTQRVLSASGFENIELENESTDINYDFIVETDPKDQIILEAVSRVRTAGTIVLKSRSANQISFPLHTLIEKELVIKAVRYAEFEEAIDLLVELNLDDLFGPVYQLEDFDNAFSAAMVDETCKHFFSLGGADVWDC